MHQIVENYEKSVLIAYLNKLEVIIHKWRDRSVIQLLAFPFMILDAVMQSGQNFLK